jgi:hypothetical protein
MPDVLVNQVAMNYEEKISLEEKEKIMSLEEKEKIVATESVKDGAFVSY